MVSGKEMAAANVTLGDVQGVLRGLLDEGVPVRDLVMQDSLGSQRGRPQRCHDDEQRRRAANTPR